MKIKNISIRIVLIAFSLISLNAYAKEKEQRLTVQQFLDNYNKEYVTHYTKVSLAQWRANIEIKEGDTINSFQAQKADEAMAAFTGSKYNIEHARKF